MFSSLSTEYTNTWKITLWFIFRTTCSHCSTATCLCRSNLPVDTAQCQLHQWGWTHCGSWGWILHSQWELERSAAGGFHKLQNWPPWPRHGVWNQCASHQTRGGWHWISWASSENKNQVCRWVPGVSQFTDGHGLPWCWCLYWIPQLDDTLFIALPASHAGIKRLLKMNHKLALNFRAHDLKTVYLSTCLYFCFLLLIYILLWVPHSWYWNGP